MNREAVKQVALSTPKVSGFLYRYGTAGFREKAEVLDAVFLRMGMLACLRARKMNASIGLMVTASHNPVQDNGIKLVDPDGGMLSQSWEALATTLANAADDEVLAAIENIAKEESIDLDAELPDLAVVYVGRDTRPHSARLSNIAIQGIEAVNGKHVDVGVVTTPQLHHCVRSSNLKDEKHLATVSGYYEKVSKAFHDLIGDRTGKDKVIVDGAFGVGGPKVQELLKVVNADNAVLEAQVRNSPTGDEDKKEEEAAKLNHGVGAEHVQKKLLLPENTLKLPEEQMVRFASFDGDADRIVYYRQNKDGKLNLFDGDKIASLMAMFIQKQMKVLPDDLTDGVSFGCVQTAYANGASSNYIREVLKVEAPLTKTGVKHLHHKAVEYDIGVYFEANGHGTVLFKQPFISKLKEAADNLGQNDQRIACKNMIALEQLINQATGDAMADLLCVEAILMVEGMSLDDWHNIYHDLPSRQLKCKVADRTAIKTSKDESKVLEPIALQNAIDGFVKQYANGRAFARPSGTEDAVRVYAEAASVKEADALALQVCQAIFDHAGGVGERPQ
uniref:Phosphoacetylglucosamine mutase n=1 Tax=Mucochytrium quahogii TaxID=96639 RepID=A0A7S2WU77_9STRA|mmetsp:Transcript_15090/g.24512  ORF Transcript_15090/g.24512 Transcript_15090/m.24512 type:complete len:560 (-) Transcript_15090:1329-3008(-)